MLLSRNRKVLLNPGQGILPFLDTFTDANGVDLVNHTPDRPAGMVWVSYSGTWDIQSNKAQATGASRNIAGVDLRQANVIATLVISSIDTPGVAGSLYGFSTRIQDASNFWLLGAEDNGSGSLQQLRIYEFSAGVPTLRASDAISPAIAPPQTLTATLNGTSITLTLGSDSANFTSSTHQNNTIFGLHQEANTVVHFDNLEVTNP